MTNPTKPDAYDLAADDLIAVMFRDKQEYEQVRFEYGLLPAYMPQGLHRQVTEALYKLYQDGKAIHDTNIIDLVPDCTPQWLLQRATLFDDTRTGQAAKDNVDIVRKHGLHRGRIRLVKLAEERMIEKGIEESETVTKTLVDMLTSIGQDARVQNVKPKEHAQVNRMKRALKSRFSSTGIPYLDQITNGYEPGHVWWVGGAYKQRKTTLALNMFLNAVISHSQSCAFLSAEMLQEEMQEWIEAMLAVAHVYKSGYYGQQYQNNNNTPVGFDWITPKLIQRMYGKYESLGQVRFDAIEWAQEQYDKLTCRIYDSTPEHGGLSDYNSVERVIGRDMVNEGGKIFFIDYLQLLDAPGNGIYERMSYLATNLQRLAKRHKICIVVLTQLNEDTIRNGDSYSPGAKGGGDPAQTANYFVTTRYNDGINTTDQTKLQVQMKLSRHGAQGSSTIRELEIHPASGLLLDTDWVQQINVNRQESII